MADRKFDPPAFDPYAERNRVIRQRDVALGLVLTFFVALFFAITVVKMRHVKMPHKSASAVATAPASAPATGPATGAPAEGGAHGQ